MSEPTCFPPSWTKNQAAWMRQFAYFIRMFYGNRIEDVPGDIVECGVGQGTTFVMLAYLAGAERRWLHGFDSFRGFAKPSIFDGSWREPKEGEWTVDKSVARKALQESRICAEFPNLELDIVPGFFADTLPKEPNYPVAFLHLDVDLHDPYRDALQHLFPRVSSGGMVLFDEYREYSPEHPDEEKWPGATKAIDDYLNPLGYKPKKDEQTGKWYVVKRR